MMEISCAQPWVAAEEGECPLSGAMTDEMKTRMNWCRKPPEGGSSASAERLQTWSRDEPCFALKQLMTRPHSEPSMTFSSAGLE